MHFGRGSDGQEDFDFDYSGTKLKKWDKHKYSPPGPRTAIVVVKNLVSKEQFKADVSWPNYWWFVCNELDGISLSVDTSQRLSQIGNFNLTPLNQRNKFNVTRVS
jgi:hypothetical protein